MEPWRFVAAGPALAVVGDPSETRGKLQDLRAAMAAADLDAVYVEQWANVAWLCGGRGNRVVLDSQAGQCGLLVGANGAWLLVPSNEEARCRAESFAGLPLPVVARAWHRLPLWQSATDLLPAGGRWVADVPVPGAGDAEPLIAPLRRVMGPADIQRYRSLAQDSAAALEAALLEATPDWHELHVAAATMAELKARDIDAAVVLVGGHERALHFRHLVPTAAEIGRSVVASVTATRHGLHASLTRSVSFGTPTREARERHDVATAVDSVLLSASRPGGTLGEALTAAEAAYTAADYYDEWREHHQGGTTGYRGREVFATPGSPEVIREGTAVAWNPTVPGAKSEDTVLVRDDGLEVLTAAPGSPWPLVYADGEEIALPRPGLLVR